MSCPKTLWDDPTGLRCVETGEHVGHVFHASDAPDRHDKTEAVED